MPIDNGHSLHYIGSFSGTDEAITAKALLRRQFVLIERVPAQKLENRFVYVASVEEAGIVAQHIDRPPSHTFCDHLGPDKLPRPQQ